MTGFKYYNPSSTLLCVKTARTIKSVYELPYWIPEWTLPTLKFTQRNLESKVTFQTLLIYRQNWSPTRSNLLKITMATGPMEQVYYCGLLQTPLFMLRR